MKNIRLVSVLIASFITASLGLSAEKADKEVTLVGAGQCSKCSLGLTPQCGNVVVVKQDGKDVTYFLAANATSTAFHDQVCTEVKEIKVTGIVKDNGGRKEIVASKVELVAKK